MYPKTIMWVYTNMTSKLDLIIKHSRVLTSSEIDDIKEEDIEEFKDIDMVGIYGGGSVNTSSPGKVFKFDELLHTLNVFFKYDVDLYPSLVEYFVEVYVMRYHVKLAMVKNVSPPVFNDIRERVKEYLIDTSRVEVLCEYLFHGITTNLKVEDLFISVGIISNVPPIFNVEDFTSLKVATGLSRVKWTEERLDEMFAYIKLCPFILSSSDVYVTSIEIDNVELFKYNIDPLNIRDCVNDIAEDGALKCLKYARSLGHEWESLNYAYAASSNGMECLLYMHEDKEGLCWDEDTIFYAAEADNAECLKFAYENGCEVHINTFNTIGGNGNLELFKYAYDNEFHYDEDVCYYAAENGHLNILKFVHELKDEEFYLDEEISLRAAKGGHINILRYLHENGYELNPDTCENASTMECLMYAIQNGGVSPGWSIKVCSNAAKWGDLNLLMYAHQNGGGSSNWDRLTGFEAARNGHIDCLTYFCENGGSVYLDEWACIEASQCQSLTAIDCLMYAHKQGSVISMKTYMYAMKRGNQVCIDYIRRFIN